MKKQIGSFALLVGLTLAADPAFAQSLSGDRGDPAAGNPQVASGTPSQDEIRYAGTIRTLLDRGKRYPTGREASLAHPKGSTEVWFVLARSGEVQSLGLERSSGSMLLDAMARSLVHRAAYPAFPVNAWQGAQARRFTVRYTFGDR